MKLNLTIKICLFHPDVREPVYDRGLGMERGIPVDRGPPMDRNLPMDRGMHMDRGRNSADRGISPHLGGPPPTLGERRGPMDHPGRGPDPTLSELGAPRHPHPPPPHEQRPRSSDRAPPGVQDQDQEKVILLYLLLNGFSMFVCTLFANLSRIRC